MNDQLRDHGPASEQTGWRTTEVADGIWAIQSWLGGRWFFQYVCLDDRGLLVDAGLRSTPAAVLMPALAEMGLADRLAVVIFTHADVDHSGGASAVQDAHPGALLAAHEADRHLIERPASLHAERYDWYESEGLGHPTPVVEWLRGEAGDPARVTLVLTGGEQLVLGPTLSLSVIHLPGHTAGHLGLFEPHTRTALIGDAVLGRGLVDTHGDVVQPPTYYELAAYRSTIDTVRRLGADRLLTAHYPPLEGSDVDGFLDAADRFDQDVADLVSEMLRRDGELTLADAVTHVDARVGPFSSMPNELAGPVRCHLDELVAKRRATRHAGFPTRWSAR